MLIWRCFQCVGPPSPLPSLVRADLFQRVPPTDFGGLVGRPGDLVLLVLALALVRKVRVVLVIIYPIVIVMVPTARELEFQLGKESELKTLSGLDLKSTRNPIESSCKPS